MSSFLLPSLEKIRMIREMEELWSNPSSCSLDNLKLVTKDEEEYSWYPGFTAPAFVSLN